MRKSDPILRTTSSYKPKSSEPAAASRSAFKYIEVETKSSTSPETLTNRLGRIFNEGAKPRRCKSIDVAVGLDRSVKGCDVPDVLYTDQESCKIADSRSVAQSTHSLPLKDVPDRRSSLASSRQASLQDFPSWRLPPPAAAGRLIPPRGRADSPVKMSSARDAVASDTARSSPSRTFIRPAPPIRLIDHGTIFHRRIEITANLKSPLFVGGGTIEGHVKIAVDQNTKHKHKTIPLLISKLSVDIVGLEAVSDGKKWVFLSLASELFDEKHPPPPSIAISRVFMQNSELFWQTHAGIASIPFSINLPLNVGPPPYVSRHASIRYIALPTLVLRDGEKRSVVSQLYNIQILTVFDPCKALASLPHPLLATEKLDLDDDFGLQYVKITAGLHRQTWVSGNSVFVDVHIINNSQRASRKLELQLQRSILWYDHAAAASGGKNANSLRLPKRQDNDIINSAVIKRTKTWKGTPPHTSEVRTCHIQVPQGHVTINTGRFFEVRYFLNVILTVALFKTVSVQLPLSLIHMNSLDIMPNALAQVAASIEAKRSKTLPAKCEHSLYQPYHEGQALLAPQKHSLEQKRRPSQSVARAELEQLKQEIDDSPRKYHHQHQCSKTVTSEPTKSNPMPRPTVNPSGSIHHRHGSDCYHCHLFQIEHEQRPPALPSPSPSGPKLPRLQVSTSGLGFTESEFSDFEIRDPLPKKVMLSEQERKMIRQQRELHHRKEWKIAQNETSGLNSRQVSKKARSRLPTVPNAPSLLEHQILRAEPHVLDPRPSRRRSKTVESPLHSMPNPNVLRYLSSARRRANTGPENYKSNALTKEVAFSQYAPHLRRPASRERGKMSADNVNAFHKRLTIDY